MRRRCNFCLSAQPVHVTSRREMCALPWKFLLTRDYGNEGWGDGSCPSLQRYEKTLKLGRERVCSPTIKHANETRHLRYCKGFRCARAVIRHMYMNSRFKDRTPQRSHSELQVLLLFLASLVRLRSLSALRRAPHTSV